MDDIYLCDIMKEHCTLFDKVVSWILICDFYLFKVRDHRVIEHYKRDIYRRLTLQYFSYSVLYQLLAWWLQQLSWL